ncbi:hypothetical protein GGR58DRAFT_119240 [Xylaria digitata]|nr:hypothetical protein GGR58DRAFT_119240 [Xylaria digitata]
MYLCVYGAWLGIAFTTVNDTYRDHRPTLGILFRPVYRQRLSLSLPQRNFQGAEPPGLHDLTWVSSCQSMHKLGPIHHFR